MATADLRLKIAGMSCTHCKKAVEKALMDIGGVEKAVVSLEEGAADVTYKEGEVTLKELKEAVQEAGYVPE